MYIYCLLHKVQKLKTTTVGVIPKQDFGATTVCEVHDFGTATADDVQKRDFGLSLKTSPM